MKTASLLLTLALAFPLSAQSSVEIFQIQGSGSSSPFEGQAVTTRGNIVTAVQDQGFFMQTPPSRSDGDIETSDGIYVFTSSVPAVNVGDEVDVSGSIIEYFELTEFDRPVVTVTGSGKPLPSPAELDANHPSDARNELEWREGMLVRVAYGTAVAPTDRFGNFRGVAYEGRTFREPGLERPLFAVFEVSANGALVNAGSTFTATGPLTYAFGQYRILPDKFAHVSPLLPRAVPERASGEMTIASLNVMRLYDDVNDPAISDSQENGTSTEIYQRRLGKLAGYIDDVLNLPDVLAVQEAENLRVLQDLATAILARSGVAYSAHLMEGADFGGIDVGFLTRETVRVTNVRQIGAAERLAADGSLLHDRPPLLIDAEYIGNGAPFPLTVIAVHQRSLSGVETDFRVRTKRFEQAASLARAIDAMQKENPARRVVVTGDFNAFEFSDGLVEVVGMIQGICDAVSEAIACIDLVETDLSNEIERLPPSERYSFIFQGRAQALDHVLTSATLEPFVRGFTFARGNADAPEAHHNDPANLLRTSDHDAPVLFLMTDYDADGIPDDIDTTPRGEERDPRKVRRRR